jgi:excisionase family DNA binding protein
MTESILPAAVPVPAPHHARAVRLACLPEILDIEGVGEALGVTPGAVRRMIARGEIPAARLGRRWRIRRVALLDAIREREVSPSPASGRPAPPRPRAEILALLARGRRGSAW